METEGIDVDGGDAPRRRRRSCFTTHTPVPAGHDRFSPELVEEHLGPLRESLGLGARPLHGPRPRQSRRPSARTFCMTVLALKTVAARQRRVVAARPGLAGDVDGALPGHATRTRCRSATSPTASTSSTWLAPQMRQVYDRHLGPDWPQRCARPGFWEAIDRRRRRRAVGDAPDAQGAADRRSRGGAPREHAERRGEPPEFVAQLRRALEPRRADHRLRAPLRHLQARQPDPAGHRGDRLADQRPADAGPVRVRRQGAPARSARQGRPAADRAADARPAVSRQGRSSSRTTTSTSAATSCRASTCG